MIIGCPGSGKSTFSRELHRITGISLFHLDMMYWNADRTKVDKKVFRKRLTDAIQQEEWIIDGNYGATFELRLQACDTVFFLDYSLKVCMEGVKSRRGKARTDIPWIESEDEIDNDFIEFIKNYNIVNRPEVMRLLEQYSDKNIIIFKNRHRANQFLNEMKWK